MTSIAIAIPHMKVHGFAGDHRLERCEDAGCTVDEHGNADCGRQACPSCGFSGSNLNALGETLAQCSCGHAWIREPQPARVRAGVAA